MVAHFRFDIGKDHSGEAQNESGSISSVELEPLLSTFAGPETTNCPSKNRGWVVSRLVARTLSRGSRRQGNTLSADEVFLREGCCTPRLPPPGGCVVW